MDIDAESLGIPDQDYNTNVKICVEINQCVGCTRQFFTKSFLGDGATVLARLSAVKKEHQHAIDQASRRWRGGRRDNSARAVKF